jgi:chitodextrinase
MKIKTLSLLFYFFISISFACKSENSILTPTVPILSANGITTNSLILSWTTSTDNLGVSSYEILRDGVVFGTTRYNSFIVANLSPSTQYTFNIRAKNNAGIFSENSNSLILTTLALDIESPSSPELSVTGVTSNSVFLSWNASSDNVGVTRYEILRNGVLFATTVSTSFFVTNLTSASEYSFCVRSKDAANNLSQNSNIVTIITLSQDRESPTSPFLTVNEITPISLNLSWTPSTDNMGVTRYEIFKNGVLIGRNMNIESSPTNFLVRNLTPLTQYSFTVRAVDAAGNLSPISNSIVVSTLADVIAPTSTLLSASGTTSASTNLLWTEASDNVGVVRYEVLRNGIVIGNTGTTTELYVRNLSPSTQYSFFIRAIDAAGNVSQSSNVLQITTLPQDRLSPTSPILSSNGITSSTVELIWTASTDNVGVARYQILRNGIVINNILDSAITTFTVTNLTPSTSYSFNLRAIDAAGNISINSNSISLVTLSDTMAPASPILSSSLTTSTSTNLSWTTPMDNVGVTSYEIIKNGILIGNSTSNSFAVRNLVSSEHYTFNVRAKDAAGNVSLNSNSIIVYTSKNDYCNATGYRTSMGRINRVQIGSINNSSTEDVGYQDFSYLSTDLQRGSINSITISPTVEGNGNIYTLGGFKVYIDFNNDGDFEDISENVVFQLRPYDDSSIFTANFTIPSTAMTGTTRMRVIYQVGIQNQILETSCGTFSYGQVEDYSIYITDNFSKSKINQDLINPKASINLYPNPVSGDVLLISNLEEKEYFFKIYNINGNEIKRGKVENNNIDVSLFPAGTYVIQILFDNSLITKRFIKL